ncbi:MAG: hypothetical protein JW969_16540 [Spirochaetales bacterium]|nr:hypothetical protein [Spirochaetales bacterium]
MWIAFIPAVIVLVYFLAFKRGKIKSREEKYKQLMLYKLKLYMKGRDEAYIRKKLINRYKQMMEMID